MSVPILILGESGTGKSSSIEKLNHKETFIIAVCNKPLPFRGFKSKYIPMKGWDCKEGNYYSTENHERIIKLLKIIDKDRPEIKTIIIDDFQYILSEEFMSRVTERGFDKFSEIAAHAWEIIKLLPNLRADLNCFVLSHSEHGENGKMKLKTIGKLLDDKVVIEGRFTLVLQTDISESGYHFLTQGSKSHIAKSPHGMFENRLIPNDLAFVIDKMNSYYNDDINQ